MEKKLTDLREQRLQKLFDDCQQQVISQIIGPFGLSTAMFKDVDRNGGNVTTLHNFSRADDDYVATESDRELHTQSQKEYSVDVRSEYEVDTKAKAENSGGKTWDEKRTDKIKQGLDEYTGRSVSSDGTIELKDGRTVRAELDHVVSVSEIHNDPKMHLALGKVTKDASTGKAQVDVSRIREVANSDENLALTNQPLNSSKSDEDLKAWAAKQRKDGTTNAEKFDVNEEMMQEKYDRAKKHIDRTADNALLKKQATELLQTGGKQAAMMGVRQALGLLLTELVNGLFNEFKVLIKQGVEAGKTLFEEIRQRLARVIESVVKKIPDAVGQMFQGGVSGFMSNLLTFLINNFLSTAKRFVTVIREGLLGLFRAFKMIFFPPKHMTGDQALQEGLKILTTVVVTSVGLLLNETVATFMATVPFLKPFADLITPVLIGIMTGLLSAFLAYQIDCMFDRMGPSFDEKMLDSLIANSKKHDEYAGALIESVNSGLRNIELYNQSIVSYQRVGESYGRSALYGASTLSSLRSSLESRVSLNMEIDETMDRVEERKIKLRNWLENKGKV